MSSARYDAGMKRQIVATDAAPKAIGPYSQAVWAGDTLFCAGQIPLDPATGNLVAGGIAEQTIRVLENIKGLLGSQGLDFANVVKATVFLSDMNNFAAMNEVYGRYFTQDFPARSTVQVARLPKDALVEIEVIACR
jgi:2-iminobutanoate/2-iminopropanoate deaminase